MRRGDGRADLAGVHPLIALQPEMRPHERLIWADRPVRGTAPRLVGRRLLLGLAVTGFACAWIGAAWLITGAIAGREGELTVRLFPLFGVPFVLLGLAILVSAAFIPARLRSTVYGLSNERIVLLAGSPRHSVRSLDLATVSGTERRERADGSGDLMLFAGRAGREGARAPLLALFGVADVGRIGREIERQRREVTEGERPPATASAAAAATGRPAPP